MTEYQFTQDWFSHNIPVWEQLVKLLPGTPGQRSFLEIGSFEGRSAVWIAENMMNSGDWIDCVDTWEGSEEHSAETVQGIEDRFDHNVEVALSVKRVEDHRPEMALGHKSYYGISHHGDNINLYKYKAKSSKYLAAKLSHFVDGENLFDFIYIDGSHVAKDVLTDACMAWPLLKQGGIMVFDDYLWGESRDILHRPKPAVDAFVNIFAESLDIVHIGHQLVVAKK